MPKLWEEVHINGRGDSIYLVNYVDKAMTLVWLRVLTSNAKFAPNSKEAAVWIVDIVSAQCQ